MLDPANELNISDAKLAEILDSLDKMEPRSFFPADARNSSAPYVERYTGPGGALLFNVYDAQGQPVGVAIEYAWLAADNYVQIAYPF